MSRVCSPKGILKTLGYILGNQYVFSQQFPHILSKINKMMRRSVLCKSALG